CGSTSTWDAITAPVPVCGVSRYDTAPRAAFRARRTRRSGGVYQRDVRGPPPDMHVSIVGPVCVWIDRLPRGSTPASESLGFAERAAARRLRRPADRACYIAGHALRRRVLSTFAQEPPEALRFVEGGHPRLVGHDDISFSLARAWVAEEEAHAIVLGVSRGVEVGAGVAADAAVSGLAPCTFMGPRRGGARGGGGLAGQGGRAAPGRRLGRPARDPSGRAPPGRGAGLAAAAGRLRGRRLAAAAGARARRLTWQSGPPWRRPAESS